VGEPLEAHGLDALVIANARASHYPDRPLCVYGEHGVEFVDEPLPERLEMLARKDGNRRVRAPFLVGVDAV